MEGNPLCEHCSAPLTGQEVSGLCANCLLKLALDPPKEATAMEDKTVDGITVKPAGFREAVGSYIGRYKLLQQIGEGGFGVVWMAEQMEPVTRRVALKVIRAGMATREVIARFEAERQALALMNHPNIAQVFDAGATDQGRPYFVMELVKGVPITQFCDDHAFTTRQRLELFGDVCSAINHAHQKGVIHRDIKPSNVMVTLHCDKPVIKVIDFGIAKATQGPLTDKTLFTRFEQFVGTPAYMSPEQSALGGLDMDTRSDIYALGVLLYELLTGRPPFEAKSLLSAGYEEMRRIIREVDPPKPSARLNTIAGEERTAVAKARQIDPEQISRLVEPDLDWIVMKAIEKDRTRRYETANGLALDIGRFLANEPVSAAAPSSVYLFHKFARRHRAVLGWATLIAVLLLTATAVSLWQAKLAYAAKNDTTEALAKLEGKKSEVDHQNARQRGMLAEAARLDRRVAGDKLLAGKEHEAFAHLARAIEYDPASTLAAEQAVLALNSWSRPPPTAILIGHSGKVLDAGISLDGARIVTASDDKTARVWDAATGRSLATLAGHTKDLLSAEFSPDGLSIVTASWDKTARVWDAATGQSLVTLSGHTAPLRSAKFSPDGTRIVTTSDDTTAWVWNAATGQCLVTLVGKIHVDNVAFSTDGTRIVAASNDTFPFVWDARVWDTTTGQKLAMFAGHGYIAGFSPDGLRIVSIVNGTARVMNAATGQCLVTLVGKIPIDDVAFSPDGTRIVTASRDRMARIWDAATGQSLGMLAGHSAPLKSA